MISATVTDNATPAIRRLVVRASGRAAFAAIGGSVAALVRDHLVKKDQTPNRLGGRRTHFYSAAANQTNWRANDTEAEIRISKDGFRQRLLGGPIRPVNHKALTIPIHPMAYGRRASEFGSELRLVSLNGGRDGKTTGLLVLTNGPDSLALYVLRTLVNQAPDPSVLPTDAEMLRAANQGLDELRLADA